MIKQLPHEEPRVLFLA